jgi:hypothetical protein
MFNFVKYRPVQLVLGSVLSLSVLFSFNAATAKAVDCTPIDAVGDTKVVLYNEFNGAVTTDTGPTALTGTTAFNNAAPIKTVIESCNVIGVEDGELVVKDAAGNVEQYNLVTGVGVAETPAGDLKPISGIVANPHAGEDLIDAANVKNPAIIDTFDDSVALIDADGTMSQYAIGTTTEIVDYTWTKFSAGGPLDGITLVDAKAQGKIKSMENGFFLVLNANGKGFWLYNLLGVSAGAWGNELNLSGGALDGKQLDASLNNTTGVAEVKYLGQAQADTVFYNSTTKALVMYNTVLHTNSWAGFATTTANAALVGGDFAGSLDAALNSGRFFGVNDCELNFLTTNSRLQQYNCLSGVLVWDAIGQPLEGPHATEPVLQADLIDTLDDGYVYADRDGTTSIYNGPTKALFSDQTWTTFTGGELDGQIFDRTKIVAAEDGLYYVLEEDGSLGAYVYLTGNYFPDVWKWSSFTSGQLSGVKLADVIDGSVDGVRFLGIAADQVVMAFYTPKPIVVIEPPVETPQPPVGTTNPPVVIDGPVGKPVIAAHPAAVLGASSPMNVAGGSLVNTGSTVALQILISIVILMTVSGVSIVTKRKM